jgi:hypothetical protein
MKNLFAEPAIHAARLISILAFTACASCAYITHDIDWIWRTYTVSICYFGLKELGDALYG